jgi:hypothetical protein
MPISGGEWTIQEYTWEPIFGLKTERALQEAGFKGADFDVTATMQAAGTGLTDRTEELLVWACQLMRDAGVTREQVKRRREQMGGAFWSRLVQLSALTYARWLAAKGQRRLDLQLMAAANRRTDL